MACVGLPSRPVWYTVANMLTVEREKYLQTWRKLSSAYWHEASTKLTPWAVLGNSGWILHPPNLQWGIPKLKYHWHRIKAKQNNIISELITFRVTKAKATKVKFGVKYLCEYECERSSVPNKISTHKGKRQNIWEEWISLKCLWQRNF